MNLGHSGYLYLLLALPVLLLFIWTTARARRRDLLRFGNPALLERAGMAVSPLGRRLKTSLIILAVILLVVALAGPQWGATREKIERKGVDVVVVLDTSLSMLARDVAPSRMVRAKAAIEKLVDMMQGDRIGIVVFAGSAYTMCPVTLDYDAARMFLNAIDVNTVPDPGTNIGAALKEAATNFDEKNEKYKAIILITDGDNLHGNPAEEAEELAKQGIVIYTIGVGDAKGASIPVETEAGVVDKTDREGNVVITRLDEPALRKIALLGKGRFQRLDNRSTGDELADIYAGISGMEKKTFEEVYQVHYEPRYQWFAGAALIALVLETFIPERRRKKS